MKKTKNLRDEGQSIVLVTLALLGFMAVLMLVIDGGNIFLKRRVAQAAADAGALAGAHEYCDPLGGDPRVTAVEYVLNNEAFATTSDVTVDMSSGEVTVVTNIPYETFFGGIFGMSNGTVYATASAICTPPSYSTAPLPVAWSCRPPALEKDDEPYPDPDNDPLQCSLNTWIPDEHGGKTEPEFDDEEEKKYYYIVMESTKGEDIFVCVDPPNSQYDNLDEDGVCYEGDDDPLFGYKSGYVDCDFDNDCENDMLANGDRGWLDLTGGGGGGAELVDFIKGDKTLTLSIHTWLGSETGNKVQLYPAIEEYLLDEDAIIPVFDYYCESDPETYCPDLIHPFDEISEEGKGKESFHITAFALFHITCVRDHKKDDSCPVYNSIAASLSEDDFGDLYSIEGYFKSGFTPDFGSLSISGADIDTYIVRLTK